MRLIETPKPETGKTTVKKSSEAARQILDLRKSQGNGSVFDDFLCTRVGDAAYLSPNFPPIDRVGPSGQKYTFNNAHNVHSSYSPSGLLVHHRRASQNVLPGDEAFGFFVATLDVRTRQTVDWYVADTQRTGTLGNETIWLGLLRPPALSAINNEDIFASWQPPQDPDAEVLFDAWLNITPRGSVFIADGRREILEPMNNLVAEVNTLTEAHDLHLDEIRWRAAQELAQAVPILRPTG
jgi:hypothetical protein